MGRTAIVLGPKEHAISDIRSIAVGAAVRCATCTAGHRAIIGKRKIRTVRKQVNSRGECRVDRCALPATCRCSCRRAAIDHVDVAVGYVAVDARCIILRCRATGSACIVCDVQAAID